MTWGATLFLLDPFQKLPSCSYQDNNTLNASAFLNTLQIRERRKENKTWSQTRAVLSNWRACFKTGWWKNHQPTRPQIWTPWTDLTCFFLENIYRVGLFHPNQGCNSAGEPWGELELVKKRKKVGWDSLGKNTACSLRTIRVLMGHKGKLGMKVVSWGWGLVVWFVAVFLMEGWYDLLRMRIDLLGWWQLMIPIVITESKIPCQYPPKKNAGD